jgi:hypothetical protein
MEAILSRIPESMDGDPQDTQNAERHRREIYAALSTAQAGWGCAAAHSGGGVGTASSFD